MIDERRDAPAVRGRTGNRGPTAEWQAHLDQQDLARSLFNRGWRVREIAQYMGLSRERTLAMLQDKP